MPTDRICLGGDLSLIKFAERELRARPGRRTSHRIMLDRDVVALVALFDAQRHSGSSARIVADALDKLLRRQPLTDPRRDPDRVNGDPR